MTDGAHRVLAIIGTALAIALPVVGHSAFAGSQAVQMGTALAGGLLATLGFTAIKPLAPWLMPWTAAHRWIAQAGVLLATVTPAVRLTFGAQSPGIALACDIALPVLSSAGFVAIHSVNAAPARGAALAIALLLLPSFASGCTPAYQKAYGACVKSAIGAAAPDLAAKIVVQVEHIMLTAGTAGPIAAGLEGAIDLGADGEFLVACAVTAWKATHPIAADAASPPPQLLEQHKGADQFLSKHPVAAAKAMTCAARALF